MDTIRKTVGQRIRLKRQELGYSQEEAAEKAGLHPTYIGQLERGEKNATIESIAKICVALDLPMEELFSKIICVDASGRTAQMCYNLISNRPEYEQRKIYNLLEEIINYKNET